MLTLTLKEYHDLQEEYDPALQKVYGSPFADGSNLDGASWDQDDIAQCQEMINQDYDNLYLESLKLFYPDDDQFNDHLREVGFV